MAARRKKKATRRRAAPKVNVVVGSKVKETIKGHGVRMAGDFGDALNAKVHEMLAGAVARCQANNRGTVRPHDL
jgi:hypothetical protein